MQLSKHSFLATYTVLSLMISTTAEAAKNARTARPIALWFLANPANPPHVGEAHGLEEHPDTTATPSYETITGYIPVSIFGPATTDVNSNYRVEASVSALYGFNADETPYEPTETDTFFMWITSAANPDVPYTLQQDLSTMATSVASLYDTPEEWLDSNSGYVGRVSSASGGVIGMAFFVTAVNLAAMVCYMGF